MASYHVNPETGKVGACRAKLHSCPFSPHEGHCETQEEARASYEKFAEAIANGESSIFQFTHEEIDAFINGDCAHLALAIHKKTGWPLVGFDEELSPNQFQHVAVQTPDGRILDVEGLKRREDFAKDWDVKSSSIHLVSIEDIKPMIDYGLQNGGSPMKTSNKILKVVQPLLPEMTEEAHEEIAFHDLFKDNDFQEETYIETSNKFLHGLPVEQKEALLGYVHNDYNDINNLLYKDKAYDGLTKKTEVRKKIKELDKALKKAPAAPKELWRSMSGRDLPQDFIKNNYVTGDIIEFPGFTSTSETSNALMHIASDNNFYMSEVPDDQWKTESETGQGKYKVIPSEEYKKGAARNVFFKISTKSAAPVSSLRGGLAEQEWLIPRGKKFRIKKIHTNVNVTELPNLRRRSTRAQIFEIEEV